MDILTLLLVPLATARLARLITADFLTEDIREWAEARLTAKGWLRLAYLITCAWCASMYVGAVLAAAWWAWGDTRWFAAALLAPAGSYVAGFLASKEGE